MKPTVPEMLEKLVALGEPDQIAWHLAEQGIKGQPGRPLHCVIAEYVRASCEEVEEVSVHTSEQGVGTVLWVTPGRWPGDVPGLVGESTELPCEVNTLARRFDNGLYPELVRGTLWRESTVDHGDPDAGSEI